MRRKNEKTGGTKTEKKTAIRGLANAQKRAAKTDEKRPQKAAYKTEKTGFKNGSEMTHSVTQNKRKKSPKKEPSTRFYFTLKTSVFGGFSGEPRKRKKRPSQAGIENFSKKLKKNEKFSKKIKKIENFSKKNKFFRFFSMENENAGFCRPRPPLSPALRRGGFSVFFAALKEGEDRGVFPPVFSSRSGTISRPPRGFFQRKRLPFSGIFRVVF